MPVLDYLASYLPRVPNFQWSLPTNLQARLLSFILAKSVGKYFERQIDQQDIAADLKQGSVSLSNVVLSPEAINELLVGFPVRCSSGKLGSIAANVSLPMSLSSKLAILAHDIELVFDIDEGSSQEFARGVAESTDILDEDKTNLAESVLSVAVAQEFVSQHLSEGEETDLRQSILSDSESAQDFPGGFDAASGTDDAQISTSLLARIVDSILAGLSLDVRNLSVVLRHGDNALRFDISAIELRQDVAELSGRRITISEPRIRAKVAARAPSAQARSGSSDDSSESSSSEESDDAATHESQMAMSRAIADLRDSTMSSSTATSMYASAVESAAFARPRQSSVIPISPNTSQIDQEDDPFLDPDRPVDDGYRTILKFRNEEAVKITMRADAPGTAAVFRIDVEVADTHLALAPRHLRELLSQLALLSSTMPAASTPSTSTSSSPSSSNLACSLRSMSLSLFHDDDDLRDPARFEASFGRHSNDLSCLELYVSQIKADLSSSNLRLDVGGFEIADTQQGSQIDLLRIVHDRTTALHSSEHPLRPIVPLDRVHSRKPSRTRHPQRDADGPVVTILQTPQGHVDVQIATALATFDLERVKVLVDVFLPLFPASSSLNRSNSSASTPRAATPVPTPSATKFVMEARKAQVTICGPTPQQDQSSADLIVAVDSVSVSIRQASFARLRVGLSSEPGSGIVPVFAALHSTDPNALATVAYMTSSDAFAPLQVHVALPDLSVRLDKKTFDDLQLWADKMSRHSSKLFDSSEDVSSSDRIVGSRYFGSASRSTFRKSTSDSESTAGDLSVPTKLLLALSLGRADVVLDLDSDHQQIKLSIDDVDAEIDIYGDPTGRLAIRANARAIVLDHEGSTSSTPLAYPMSSGERMISLKLSSSTEPGTTMKESRIDLRLAGFLVRLTQDLSWLSSLQAFAKAPAGVFEGVVPNELTRLKITVVESGFLIAPTTASRSVAASIAKLNVVTNLMPDLPRNSVAIDTTGFTVLGAEGEIKALPAESFIESAQDYWTTLGFVPIVDVHAGELVLKISNGSILPDVEMLLGRPEATINLCADTLDCVSDVVNAFKSYNTPSAPARDNVDMNMSVLHTLAKSIFNPALSDLPDLLEDDLPTNYAFMRAGVAGEGGPLRAKGRGELISDVNGETIRLFKPEGIVYRDGWLDVARTDDENNFPRYATRLRTRINNANVNVRLFEGYDWPSTRKAIEDRARAIRRKLERIKQLLASGQAADAAFDEASVTMFGSVELGLPANAAELPRDKLMALVDEELDDTASVTTEGTAWEPIRSSSRSSQASRPTTPRRSIKQRRKQLTRSASCVLDVQLSGLSVEADQFTRDHTANARMLVQANSIEVLDNFPTSTWRKFLSELRPSEGGIIRETGTPMLKAEVLQLPVGKRPDEAPQLNVRVKLSPLRLYIDQDALDFIKRFAAFDVRAKPLHAAPSANDDLFFQRFEVFPVKVKLDYKPKRVDFNALRQGRTAELMNFFHFDGSEMVLRHLILSGISGSARLSDMIQDIWTPDVKANQLSDVVAGIAPVRSVVNVGTGVANLVLLPMEQYRKDGRIVRGLQKGAKEFARTTTLEALNVGARLATGTQVILEKAESVLGGGFSSDMTFDTVQDQVAAAMDDTIEEVEREELISRYAEQPQTVREGVEGAYRSLGTNLRGAAQTILAVPMEVYERSGSEGSVRAVVRAVPVAVLRPMIGATEAVSKTLFGLRNTLSPDSQAEAADKYKSPRFTK